jgi:hypothetical protein
MVNYDMVLRFIFVVPAWSCGELGVLPLDKIFPESGIGVIVGLGLKSVVRMP